MIDPKDITAEDAEEARRLMARIDFAMDNCATRPEKYVAGRSILFDYVASVDPTEHAYLSAAFYLAERLNIPT